MVSKKRAGPRNRNLQLRNQYRRNSYTTHRPVDRGTPWLALGISADWRSGICLAGCVVVAIPKTRTTFLLLQTRKIKGGQLLPHRQTWAFAAGKFMIDPIWWFYLFWIPDYLQRQHGLHLTQIGLPIVVIYVISDLGSIAGGWLSSSLIRRHFSINAARKWAMLISALCVVPVAAVFRVSGLWPATLLIGLAAAGHQGFSANLFTLTSDLFPSRAVASVVGIGGMAGAVGGMLIAEIVGHLLQWTGSYMIPFFMAASAYLIALLLIQLLSPKLIPARIGQL